MSRYGIIDLGSNTIRLCIYEVQCAAHEPLRKKDIDTLLNYKVMAGLASHVKEGAMTEEGVKRAIKTINAHLRRASHFNCDRIDIFATAVLRNCSNSHKATAEIEEGIGMRIAILSNEEEAHLGYLGAKLDQSLETGTMVDIGGGSTEWVCFSQGRIRHAASIPLGSLNLYNRCVETLLPSPKEQAKIRKQVKKALDGAPLPDFPCPVICGVGGTIRGAGKLCNYLYKLPAGNRTITLNMVDGLLERFSAPAKADLQILLKIVPERVHTLLPGLVILSTLAHRCRGDAIEVSSYGVREGFLLTEVLKRRSVTV